MQYKISWIIFFQRTRKAYFQKMHRNGVLMNRYFNNFCTYFNTFFDVIVVFSRINIFLENYNNPKSELINVQGTRATPSILKTKNFLNSQNITSEKQSMVNYFLCQEHFQNSNVNVIHISSQNDIFSYTVILIENTWKKLVLV